MSKPYNIQHIFAGSGCRAGTMICCVCRQPVDSAKDDWELSQKNTKDGDWGYRNKHRSCVENQQGWVKIENRNRREAEAITRVTEKINKLIEEYGEHIFDQAVDIVRGDAE